MNKLVLYLKRSQFLVGISQALRGLKTDLLVLFWVSRRNGTIDEYLNTHPTKKLQLAASNNLLSGWLNTDIFLNHKGVAYLDATRRFPFKDNTFDYIMAEHMIEHLSYSGAQVMLKECFRVLKPGGRVRIATPDLDVLLAVRAKDKSDAQTHYVGWATAQFLPDVRECAEVFVINNFFREWGHSFLYDQATLDHALSISGFGAIKFFKPGASEDHHLENLECHGRELGSEDINQFETMVAEGLKGK